MIHAVMFYRRKDWYHLYAYCVMPDHVHLVLGLQKGSPGLSNVVGNIKRAARHFCKRVNRDVVWQDGFHDRILRENETSGEMVKYVLLNPVRAHLVSDFSEYPYSGRPDPFS